MTEITNPVNGIGRSSLEILHFDEAADAGAYRPSTFEVGPPMKTNDKFIPEETSFFNIWNNPFFLFFLSFICAMIFTIFPNSSWIYILIRNQWWATLCVIAYAELQELCVLGSSDWTYIMAYFGGFTLPLVFYFCFRTVNMENNFYVSSSIVNTPLVLIIIVYSIDACCCPSKSTRPVVKSAASIVPYDTFSSSIPDIECIAELAFGYDNSVSDTSGSSSITSSSNSQSVKPARNRADSESKRLWREHYSGVSTQPWKSTSQHSVRTLQDAFKNSSANRNTTVENNAVRSVALSDFSDSESNLSMSGGSSNFINNSFNSRANRPTIFSTDRCLYFLKKIFFFLPRYQFEACGMTVGESLRDRRVACFFSSFLIVLFIAYYYFLIIFTQYFRSHSNGNPELKMGMFLIFVAISTTFRTAVKRCGLLLDKMKIGSSSVFFIGEVICLLFYYTFYRVLFESLNSWTEFLLFQLVHLISEWMLYPFRASTKMFSMFLWMDSFLPGLSGLFMTKGINRQDWLAFIALDFGIRCCVMVATGTYILLLFLTIDFVPWVTNSLRQTKYAMALSSSMICVAVILEILNAIIMNYLFFEPSKTSVLRKVTNCFSDPRFALFSTVIAAVLFINPMYAFTTNITY